MINLIFAGAALLFSHSSMQGAEDAAVKLAIKELLSMPEPAEGAGGFGASSVVPLPLNKHMDAMISNPGLTWDALGLTNEGAVRLVIPRLVFLAQQGKRLPVVLSLVRALKDRFGDPFFYHVCMGCIASECQTKDDLILCLEDVSSHLPRFHSGLHSKMGRGGGDFLLPFLAAILVKFGKSPAGTKDGEVVSLVERIGSVVIRHASGGVESYYQEALSAARAG